MKNLGWLIGGGLLLLTGKKAPGQTTAQGVQLGNYATPPITRPGSTAGRSQAASGGPSKSSTGGGGGAPGTQATGKGFWNALENLFTGSSTSKIDTSTSPDPSVPDFWANPTPEGTSNVFGNLLPPTTDDSKIPQFGGDPSLQFDDNGLLINPDTGVPFGQTSTDVTTPGGFFPDQFGPDAPPDPSQTEPDIPIFDNNFF